MTLVRIKINKEKLRQIKRRQRVSKILAEIKIHPESGYLVKSYSDGSVTYDVYNSYRKGWLCTCRHFAIFGTECTHISAAREYSKYYKDLKL